VEVTTPGSIAWSTCEADSPADWWSEWYACDGLEIRDGYVHVGELRIAARPLVGCIATAPDRETVFSKMQGPYGGNMDCNEVREGATVVLPVEVDGAYLYFGDSKARMGDGEVVQSPEVGTRLEVSVEEWQDVIATNLHASFYLMRAVLPGMLEQGSGSIIALGGQAAITGRPETAVVTTAKTGLLGLIRAVAAEYAGQGVRANLVNPGATNTSREHPEWYPEFQEVARGSSEHLKSIPMGRQGTVQDIANACLFYASDESSYITGHRMNVVGGRYIV